MMRTTQWREYTERGTRLRIRATYGFHKIGEQEPYFSVTGETERLDRGRWREDSGGCLHDQIAEHFPELAGVLRWHLCFESEGPMHYVANAEYFWSLYLQRTGTIPLAEKSWARPRDEDTVERLLDGFKSTVVFGAVDGDELPEKTVESVKGWCASRFEKLMAAFKRDVDAIPHEKLASEGEK